MARRVYTVRLTAFVAALTFLCFIAALNAAGPATAPADDNSISPGDLLAIGVEDLDLSGGEAPKTTRVDSDGFASLFIVGPVRLGGLDAKQAVEAIQTKYKDTKILANPVVSLNRIETAAAAKIKPAPIDAGDTVAIQILNIPGDETTFEKTIVIGTDPLKLPFLDPITLAGMSEAEADQMIFKAYQKKEATAVPLVSVLRLKAGAGGATTQPAK